VAVALTSLSHGAGCGCKLPAAAIGSLLAQLPQSADASVLVGYQTADDAGVYQLREDLALVHTADFFTPIVDDPFDFGRIAATNALSDVYAMGATPIFALAIVGMPVDRLPVETIQAILAGGAATCAEAGIPIAGGHSIDSVEPIYGLVALGLVHPDRVLTNRAAQAGDALILTKALGVGVLSAAFKQQRLPPGGYEALVATTTQLNSIGAALGDKPGVHAVTDVTGFGLLGHGLEMARGANLTAEIFAVDPALLEGVQALAQAGVRTGAAARNWASYGDAVRLPADLPEWRKDVLCDPQTSGGLLIAVEPRHAETVLKQVSDAGFGAARIVGRLRAGAPEVHVI
jgi:selenide,water dikinase